MGDRFMTKKYLISILVAVSLLLLISPSPANKLSDWEWQGVERVVAIGDVHGYYDSLTKLLLGLDLTSEDLKWTGGKTHVVLCGDLLDRGKQERPLMDLLIRLQEEAKEQGGQIHTLLGNHDVMNLVRDFRYVDKANYADFAKEEKARDRKKGWNSFKQLYAGKGFKDAQIRAAFDEKYPPGYFARQKEFELKGKYGAWLLGHPTAIKINDVVYVHAGLKKATARLGIDNLNNEVQQSIKNFHKYMKILEPYIKGIAGYEEFWAVADAISSQSSSGQIPQSLADAARGVLEESEKYAFAPDGPFWYRGNSLYNELGEWATVDDSLKILEANTLVVGHTPTKTGRIQARFGNHLYRTDVGMGYGRAPYALEISGKERRIFNPQTTALEVPELEDTRGENFSEIPEQLPEPQMKNFLLRAEIVSATQEVRDSRQYSVVMLKDSQSQRRALFMSVAGKPSSDPEKKYEGYRHYKHEYATYLLDREFGTEFVPVTVIREVDGKLGSLQEWMEKAINLPALLRNEKLGTGIQANEVFEEMRDMVAQGRLFWALIDVRDNHEALRMYIPEEKKVMGGDNSWAFSLSPDVQEALLYPADWVKPQPENKLPFKLNPSFELALRSMEFGRLKELLGEYLSDDQISALLKRRDVLLERCSVEYKAEEKSFN